MNLLFKLGLIIQTKKDIRKNVLVGFLNSLKERKALSSLEYYYLNACIKKTGKIEGDIAEVGVYKGSSAKIIAEATNKEIHLFDTFEGLPESDGQFKKGEYKSSYEDVKNYLNYPNVHIYRGLFPETARPIKDRKFSLVHLDVDIYSSTLQGLEFFWPRMSWGG